MKKTIKLAVVAALALGTTSAFATNGTNLIGLGAKSRAMGGTGIATFNGAENGLTNPALLTKIKNKESSFGGTAFMPDVKVSSTLGNVSNAATGTSKDSTADLSPIPMVTLADRINDNLVFGIGMYGTAGMGVDFRGLTLGAGGTGKVGLYNMRSNLQIMQFAPSLAYGNDKYGIGLTGILQYGSLSIDFDQSSTTHIGNGPSDDFGMGFQVGAFANVIKGLTVAATYKSAIDMKYKDQISNAAAAFGYTSASSFGAYDDNLEQPAEIGAGISYSIADVTVAFDYKFIQWAEAQGYKSFGWENQSVYAVGARYEKPEYWVGLGYNYGKTPLRKNTDTTTIQAGYGQHGDTMNTFNYVLFPATTESHFTVGAGAEITDGTFIDAAFTYAPETSNTVNATSTGLGDVTTKHSQKAVTVALRYNF